MTRHPSIHSAFYAITRRNAEAVALAAGDSRMSYGELDRRSGQLAAWLRQRGVVRGDRVGLYSQRSVDALVAILAILKAGAAYVPFDPAYPAKLLEFIYADCAPKLMLAQSSLAAVPGAKFWQGDAADIAAALSASASLEPFSEASVVPDDVAYVMYTSGSTGHPKGVLIPHRGVIRLVIGNSFADMGPEQTHLHMAPLAFDASTFEIWGALLNGGTLALLCAPYPSLDDIAEHVSRHAVTTLWLTAGLFHLMVDHRLSGLTPLRQLLAGGDVLSPAHVAKAQAALPHCQIINGYGPTENTTFTCCYRIPRLLTGDGGPGLGPIPIGTPIVGTRVHIWDAAGNPVPNGEDGELFAGGDGVGLGYLNRDELTAERFIPDPSDPTGVAKLYRTGDRVRQRPDGAIEFLGRVDRQVKISGKRVELDEIEAVLRRSPLVEDAAVTSPAVETGQRRVHAYVKFRTPNTSPINELRDFIKLEVPDYMMPSTFTAMDALPLSPTGKIDRARLRVPAVVEAPAPAAAEGTELERSLLQIWRKVLNTNAVGVNDNFFDLGGTSLQLIQVHATIAAMMQSDVTVVDLFQYPKISALAARLAGSPAGGPASGGADLKSGERARRQQAALALARSRTQPRRSAS